MAQLTKVILKTIPSTEKDRKRGQTAHNFKGNTKMAKRMVKDSSSGAMEALTKEIL